MLGKVLGFLTRPPVPFVLGILLLLAVIWFGGHFLARELAWQSTTWITVACVAVVVGAVLYVVLRSLRARQKARAIENEIRNQGRAQAAGLPPDSRDEFDALQSRFDEALASLKASKLGRGALYAMPWFVVIGPPGSGKTTAITESGLNFPAVKGPSQKRGIRGVGGTRNCDWWFTDQAILLDTAGRYTTQAEDRDEWLAFLGMLKKARKLKPINGALVAFSITDVLEADEDALERHAATIRQRIDELVKQLEVVFPVYLMLTKCDLLDGFVEFFQSLSKEERAQVWGTTFDRRAPGEIHERFAQEFDLLCRQVDVERSRLLVADRPALQQQKIFSLPLQMRAAKRKLTEFVRLLTQPNPYSDASELRGVYLTSGTQEGAPIDLVLKRMSAAFGVATRIESGAKPAVEQKSYFLRDMFTRVMQADRDLARSSARVQRRRELGRKALVFGSAAAAIAGAAWAVSAWSDTRAQLAAFAVERADSQSIAAGRNDEPSAESKEALNRLRDRYLALEQAYATTNLLGPRRSVVDAAMRRYAAAMRGAFLEPLAKWVKAELQRYVDGPSAGVDYKRAAQLVLAYEAFDDGYLQSDTHKAALRERHLWRWAPDRIGEPAEVLATSEESKHLDAYVAARAGKPSAWAVGIDAGLLGRARQRLESGPEVTNVVNRLMAEDPTLLGLSEADLVAELDKRVKKMSGSATTITPDSLATLAPSERRRLILADMAKIGLADTSSLPKVVESLTDFAASDRLPVREFQRCLAALRQAGAAPSSLGADDALTIYVEALKAVANLRGDLNELVKTSVGRGYVLGEVSRGRENRIQALSTKWIAAQDAVAQQVKQLAAKLGASEGDQNDSAIVPIRVSFNRMFAGIAEALARSARDEMEELWRQEVGGTVTTVATRYPCRRDAEADATPGEFAALFMPKGLLEAQFARIDQLHAIPIPEVNDRLRLHDEFESFRKQAVAIRDACFGPDAPSKPRLQFRVSKITRDAVLNDVKLVIAQGNALANSEGSMNKIANQVRRWEVGQTGAQLELLTVIRRDGKDVVLTLPKGAPSSSDWGLLRVLGLGKAEPVGRAVKITWTVAYQRDDLSAASTVCWMQFEPEGTENPLRPGFFEFAPPAKLFQDTP